MSSWAAVLITGIMMLLGAGGLVWRDGRRDGRTDTILERLTDLAEDHETRLRGLEDTERGRPRRHAR